MQLKNIMVMENYNLDDKFLINLDDTGLHFKIWVPKKEYLIIGRSNKPEKALIRERALKDKISIMMRPSGGQTVLLSPNMIIISISFKHESPAIPKLFFSKINLLIIKALQHLGVNEIFCRGISDIALNDKKIFGSSIYKKGAKIFYHAVLNIKEHPERISYYLAHPTVEPAYRNGRPHSEFVTSLHLQGYYLNSKDIKESVRSGIIANFNDVHEYIQ